jgi:hypothetical protein
MAPESPGNLVVLDMHSPDANEYLTVWHWDPEGAEQWLHVLWEAAQCPNGYVDAAGGVICIAVPPGFRAYRYEAVPPPGREPLVYSWRGQVKGTGLMVVAVFPRGHVLVEPNRTEWPVDAKVFDGRMAAYWLFANPSETIDCVWRAEPLRDRSLDAICAEMRSPNAASLPEPPTPSPQELEKWSSQIPETIVGRPPSENDLTSGDASRPG